MCGYNFERFFFKGQDEYVEKIYTHVKNSNILHLILMEEQMSTCERRNTQMAKLFHLCRIRHIPLHGKEPGQIKKSSFVYISPR